jgi:hypothetical protein
MSANRQFVDAQGERKVRHITLPFALFQQQVKKGKGTSVLGKP